MTLRKRKKQSGFSLIELLIVVAIILVIAAIAIPSLIKSRQTSNASAAVGTLKTVNTDMVNFATECGTVGFPATLAALGPGDGTCTGGFNSLDSTMGVAAPAKAGYNFTYAPGAAAANGVVDSYTINADPWSATSALKHFYTDQSGAIHVNSTGPATVTDPGI